MSKRIGKIIKHDREENPAGSRPEFLASTELPVAGGRMHLSYVKFDFLEMKEEPVAQPYVALILGEPLVRIQQDGQWRLHKFSHGQLNIQGTGRRGAFQSSGDCEIVTVSLDEAVLKHITAQMELPSQVELADNMAVDSDFLHGTLLALRNEVTGNFPSGSILCESLQTSLCSYLLTYYSTWNPSNRVKHRRRSGLSQQTLKRIEEYVADNFQRDISLSELAQLAFLSTYHFIRMFKMATGFSPYNYLSNLRVKKAAALIRAGSTDIANIAQAVGFRDNRALYRQFKRILGQTPAAYIKRCR